MLPLILMTTSAVLPTPEMGTCTARFSPNYGTEIVTCAAAPLSVMLRAWAALNGLRVDLRGQCDRRRFSGTTEKNWDDPFILIRSLRFSGYRITVWVGDEPRGFTVTCLDP